MDLKAFKYGYISVVFHNITNILWCYYIFMVLNFYCSTIYCCYICIIKLTYYYEQTLQSVSIVRYSTPTDYGTTIKSFHTEAVCYSKPILQTASPQIAPEEANHPRPYRTTLSQLRYFFCSSLHSYRERIGLVPCPFCLSCELMPLLELKTEVSKYVYDTS